ncbi:MAG: hypothetical protein ACPGR8_01195 [Limisphaerales bacterium]
MGQLDPPIAATADQTIKMLIQQHRELNGWCDVSPFFTSGNVAPDLSGLRRCHDTAAARAKCAARQLLCTTYKADTLSDAVALVPDEYRADLSVALSH